MSWISVKDRLPLDLDPLTPHKTVFVIATDGVDVGVNMFASGNGCGKPWREFSKYFGEIESSKITHWQPLPEPPKDD